MTQVNIIQAYMKCVPVILTGIHLFLIKQVVLTVKIQRHKCSPRLGSIPGL